MALAVALNGAVTAIGLASNFGLPIDFLVEATSNDNTIDAFDGRSTSN